ncbi:MULTISPECIES: CpaF family protein [Thermoanaerobacterium]|uniref:Type II secretion system protein E n=2 Tax=Thermoanaerobacterium TaxID=28895 RepID=W9ECM3_9THEO|nr:MULTISPECIES: CpaF/VirB11 family protein [Thermoanaerobacterium]AFK85900.1 type II secretion system protein E [Thermoanaerobacterium saccharolyticum JW/SL-YS485]ETO38760.1 type II secretion system protein E [Thermoanaerobacterium aotearoense SCUT27]
MGLAERSKMINNSKRVDIDLIIKDVRPLMFNRQGDLREFLRIEIKRYIEQNFPHYLNELDSITDDVYDKMYGLGVFEKYLKMEDVTDIFSFGTKVMYIKNGEKIDDPVGFKDIEDVKIIYNRIVSNALDNISWAEPSKDAELYDGSRVKIIIPPEAAEPYIIIRKHTHSAKDIDQLKAGMPSLDEQIGYIGTKKDKVKNEEEFIGTIADYLKHCVRNRKNVVVIGETNAGKTTLINAMTHYIQPNHVVAVLEDTREMLLPLPYVFYLKTREEKEGAKAITYEDILNDCLRSNPDRIILTEIRTPISAYTFIHTLNSGHAGSFTTLHADDIEMGLDRLETLIKEYKPIDAKVVKRLIAKAIDVLIFIGLEEDERGNTTGRAIKEIAELKGLNDKDDYILEYKYYRW